MTNLKTISNKKHRNKHERIHEKGNMLFMILIAVVLIGLVTAAIQSSSRPEGSNIDKETLAIRASEVQRYASQLETGIKFIVQQNAVSESDIRFSHPDAHTDYGDLSADGDPTDQMFHRLGGAAVYQAPPDGINDGSAWEFYAGTDLPQVGSSRADLVALLPNVTQDFCNKINEINAQSSQQPVDSGNASAVGNDPGSCIHIGSLGRVNDTRQFYDSPATPNTFNEATMTSMPSLQGCVQCEMNGASTEDEYHFYHVLLAR